MSTHAEESSLVSGWRPVAGMPGDVLQLQRRVRPFPQPLTIFNCVHVLGDANDRKALFL